MIRSLCVSDLKSLASGLNIEGGSPYQLLIKQNQYKKVLWINLVLVLDRPLIDHVLFEELDKKMKDNEYPLLENTVDTINEHQMFATYIMIIGYYMEYGREMIGKNKTDPLRLTIHIHQSELSINMIKLLNEYIGKLNIDMTNITLDYRTDKPLFVSTEHNYKGTDILISLSQCAGIDSSFEPGSMIISSIFIPYDIKNKSINLDKRYVAVNDLVNNFDQIIESKYNKLSVKLINDEYVSKNKHKINDRAKTITINDFAMGSILQVNDLWNPTDENESLFVVE